jgi:hypothetical protein
MICKRYSQHLQPMRERPSNFDFGLLPCHILDLVHHAKTRNSRHSLYPTPTRKTDLNVDVLLTLLAGFIGFPWGLTGSEPVHARRAKLQNPLYPSVFQRESSGRGGIRTHGWFNPTFDFESSALNRTQPPFLIRTNVPLSTHRRLRQGKADAIALHPPPHARPGLLRQAGTMR